MTGNLIAVTRKSQLNPLAFQGIMAYSCFPQIRDMLSRKFGDEYVLLFARPVENVAEGQIDWYSPVQGQSRPLSELPESERASVCAHVGSMADDIAAYAEELVQSGDPLKTTRGNILKLALKYPDESSLYLVGEQPVFTCWGFAPGTPGAEPKLLTRIASSIRKTPIQDAAPPPPPPPAGAQAAEAVPSAPDEKTERRPFIFGWGWLWWLVPLLLLLLLLCLLFTSFSGLRPLSGIELFSFPESPFGKPGQRADKSRINSLENEIAMLEKEVQEKGALCVPKKPVPPLANAAPMLPENKEEELVIPKNADDASFLEGLWRCETGLANAATGEPIKVTIEFDKDGAGRAIVNEKEGRECRGPARASLNGGILSIVVDEQKCPQGSYDKVTIDCKNAQDGSTACAGVNADGSRWKATFYKLK